MADLVQCKACGKEIAKGVKKCPSCGKDQRNWFFRHKFLSFIGVFFILGIIGILGSGDDSETVTTSDSIEAKQEEVIYKVGDIVHSDQLDITVDAVEEQTKVGGEYLSKNVSDGGVFVAIQYTMKNVSDEPVGMFDYPAIYLVDEKGTEYDADIDASSYYATQKDIDNSKILSDLNPDISVKDTEVYEVSAEQFSKGEWFIKIGDVKIKIK